MERIPTSTGSAKQRLLEAAELLFAERGFDAVSVRDITTAAKMNVAAVNYHFGSRDGLVAAVIKRYVTPINEERLARVDAAERRWSGKAVPLEELLEAMLRPLISQVRRSELSERLFCCLIGRTFSRREGFPPAVEEQFRAVSDRFMRAFAKALPEVSQEDWIWKLHFVVGAALHTLAQADLMERLSNGTAGKPTLEQTFNRLMRFALAGLREGVAEPAKVGGPQAFFDF